MSLYDYLGGEQVKIFYSPSFIREDELFGNNVTCHIGGSLMHFNEKDKLPSETLYYKYPDNFLVYDYRIKNPIINIVKNTNFFKNINLKDLRKNDLIDSKIFDYYGRELNIKTIKDFSLIHKDFNKMLELCRKKEYEIFPDGSSNTIRKDLKYFEENKEKLYSYRDNLVNEFHNKWFVKNLYEKEIQFGEYLECFIDLAIRVGNIEHDKELTKFEKELNERDEKDFLAIIEVMKNYISDNENIIEKYKNWLNNNEKLNKISFENIIEFINNFTKKESN